MSAQVDEHVQSSGLGDPLRGACPPLASQSRLICQLSKEHGAHMHNGHLHKAEHTEQCSTTCIAVEWHHAMCCLH